MVLTCVTIVLIFCAHFCFVLIMHPFFCISECDVCFSTSCYCVAGNLLGLLASHFSSISLIEFVWQFVVTSMDFGKQLNRLPFLAC